MEAVIILLLIYVLIYSAFIFALLVGFRKVSDFKYAATTPQITFSIIIPFRNEDENLPRLLDSISNIDYPKEKFELIFVDDFSEDFSVNKINKWRMQNGLIPTTILENLRLSNSPKKDAIARAMPIIENQWVITTDADCIIPVSWLQSFNAFILANEVEMISAPVFYDGKFSFLHHFERLDMMSLQGATVGGFGLGTPFMCNGANFAYTKKLFMELGGFAGNKNIASGDDVFLLHQAVAKKPNCAAYLKSAEAIVITNPTENWWQLLNQRARWAAKATSYENNFASDLSISVLFGNLASVTAAILSIFGIIDWRIAIVLFIIKCIPDFAMLIAANKFFRSGRFFFPIFSALIYPFFCVAVALFALFGKYSWKGRKYSM